MKINIQVTKEELDQIYDYNITSDIGDRLRENHLAGEFLELINDEMELPANNVCVEIVDKAVF